MIPAIKETKRQDKQTKLNKNKSIIYDQNNFYILRRKNSEKVKIASYKLNQLTCISPKKL